MFDKKSNFGSEEIFLDGAVVEFSLHNSWLKSTLRSLTTDIRLRHYLDQTDFGYEIFQPKIWTMNFSWSKFSTKGENISNKNFENNYQPNNYLIKMGFNKIQEKV